MTVSAGFFLLRDAGFSRCFDFPRGLDFASAAADCRDQTAFFGVR